MELTLYNIAKEVAEKALNEITYEGKTLREWVEIIVKQQPCEDCISREQTLKAFAEKCGGECACCEYNGSGYDNAENCKLIKSMPSVTPEKSKGKWVYKMQVMNNPYTYKCSVCKGWEKDKTKYCPNCGADMGGDENEMG